MNYSDGPAVSLATIDGDALLVTKGTKWSYEREWRMLVPLRDATRTLKVGEDTIYLFAFPPETLRGIILGAYSTAALEASVRNLLDGRPELRHVNLSRALLDFDTRCVKVQWASMDV